MSRHRKEKPLSPEEIGRMNKDLLIALANAVAANEQTQCRFRTAVFIRLSRIETMLSMIHGAQIVECHGSEPGAEQKSKEHAMAAEKFIAQGSHKMGLAMVKYLYGESDEPITRRDRRRKWTDWEI